MRGAGKLVTAAVLTGMLAACASSRDETRVDAGPVAAAAGVVTTPRSSAGRRVSGAMTPAALVEGLDGLGSRPDAAARQSIVVDAADVLGYDQVTDLLSRLQADPGARLAADALTRRLQERGVLAPDERVVGYRGGELFKTSRRAPPARPRSCGMLPPWRRMRMTTTCRTSGTAASWRGSRSLRS